MAQTQNVAPITKLIKTVKGERRNFIYYDPDVFNDKILLSASLLIGDDEVPFNTHYNTVHDEDLGTSGTNFEDLENITIAIYPKPPSVMLEGVRRMEVNSSREYKLPDDYDTANNFSYDWHLEGPATFDTIPTTGDKKVSITFNDMGTVTLKVKITNPGGCYRWVIRNLYPGTLQRRMLVVRNPYFKK